VAGVQGLAPSRDEQNGRIVTELAQISRYR
jgi:hypothetical protein